MKTTIFVTLCSTTPKNLKLSFEFIVFFFPKITKQYLVEKSYFGFSPGAADSDSFLRLNT